jgi:TrmH family RNA methyltransferase
MLMSPTFERITSRHNVKVKLVNMLRSKRGRARERLFVIDGARDLERALDADYEAAYVFVCSERGQIDTHSIARIQGPVYDVSHDIMKKVSYRENPSAVVAVMRQKPLKESQALSQIASRFILGLVDLRKPGNIGALMRTADAAGFGAILLIDSSLDLHNPNIIRSSTGACFLDNVYSITSAEALCFFKSSGYAIVAGHPDGARGLFETRFEHPTAVILGAEDVGLDTFWVANSDETVTIPMSGTMSDSLNVSVSGAILMYEIYRQQQHTPESRA